MRNGGDDYAMFVGARNAYDFGAALDEAVQAYVVANSPVAPALDGRISQAEGEAMAGGAVEAPAMVDGAVCAEEYVVQADDWLSKLADRFLGDAQLYSMIAEATNQMQASDDSFAQISNPDVIDVGWKLCIPKTE